MMPKHFTLSLHVWAPTGWKVVCVLNELGFSYETVYLDLCTGEHKLPQFLKANPNGRFPMLVDHMNDGFIVWESAAIMLYLVDNHDSEKRLAVTSNVDRHLYQWLLFQASPQGVRLRY
ncbi:hypothetical protein EUX98_g6959 [Antrodiella citrinella]|uniref:GST N-terminal domain-containing protein n=1 Tax=Antrodiella citrinella TaxID=2447956 RepID=A0A4V3XHZ0_9APHY|nr:hypothetical protein EUX98_g6959 [Antrodiella citrinella]